MSTRIYEWRQVVQGIAGGYDEEPNQATFTVSDVFAGWTLERTLWWVRAEEDATYTSFPPPHTNQWAVALYHARNAAGSDLEPGIQDWETDWVAYGVPEWFADYGALTTTEQDLALHASLFVDSSARRAILQDNPTVTVAWGYPNGIAINTGTRLRQAAISWTARFLYSHPA